MPRLPIGAKVKFQSEKMRYTVQASDERFTVCTKPFNPKHTVLYSIIDFKEGVRGPENLIFGHGAETQQQCEDMLDRLNGRDRDRKETERVYLAAGLKIIDIPPICHSEVSHRHRCNLDIEKIFPPKE